MGMPAMRRGWSAAAVRELQDESRGWPRYELIDGELLVTPGPRPVHQIATFELARHIADYVDRQRLGMTSMSPADLELEPETVTQPDVFVVPAGAGKKGPLVKWSQVEGLLLAVEVISPSSAKIDRIIKRALFQRVGVPEYWVVDADARAFERWRPRDTSPEILRHTLSWRPTGSTAPLELDLPRFFAKVCDGDR